MEAWVGDLIQFAMLLVILWQSHENGKKLTKVAEATDGIVTKLVKSTSDASFAQGVKHEQDKAKET